MPRPSAVLIVALVACALAPVGSAQTKIEAADIVDHPFSVDFASGDKLRLHVRSG